MEFRLFDFQFYELSQTSSIRFIWQILKILNILKYGGRYSSFIHYAISYPCISTHSIKNFNEYTFDLMQRTWNDRLHKNALFQVYKSSMKDYKESFKSINNVANPWNLDEKITQTGNFHLYDNSNVDESFKYQWPWLHRIEYLLW